MREGSSKDDGEEVPFCGRVSFVGMGSGTEVEREFLRRRCDGWSGGGGGGGCVSGGFMV